MRFLIFIPILAGLICFSVYSCVEPLKACSERKIYIQSFAPEENVTPELAHEIGMELAMYFGGYQAVVSTHINEAHIHNHIVFNSVNFENGKKFHQSRDVMLKVKEYSNKQEKLLRKSKGVYGKNKRTQ